MDEVLSVEDTSSTDVSDIKAGWVLSAFYYGYILTQLPGLSLSFLSLSLLISFSFTLTLFLYLSTDLPTILMNEQLYISLYSPSS